MNRRIGNKRGRLALPMVLTEMIFFPDNRVIMRKAGMRIIAVDLVITAIPVNRDRSTPFLNVAFLKYLMANIDETKTKKITAVSLP
jgi:hypothetical protein